MPECLIAVALQIFHIRKDFRRIRQKLLKLTLPLDIRLLPKVASIEVKEVESQIHKVL
jgi:hypothetical protein